MSDQSTSPIKQRLLKAADLVFHPLWLLLALVLLGGMFAVSRVPLSDAKVDIASRTLRCTTPVEVARMSDGSTVLNDSRLRVLCIGPDGVLRFHIDAGRNQHITGVTLDESDNIYFYCSDIRDGTSVTLTDRICVYDSAGKFVKTLYTIDYSLETPDSGRTARTSPMHIENGVLYFTRYETYSAQLFQINVRTGDARRNGVLNSGTAFAYNDVAGGPGGTYYYAKCSGEIGFGTLGGGKTVLCQCNYDIANGTGVRPYYVCWTGGAVYVYDYFAPAVYALVDGALLPPSWTGEDVFAHGTYELCTVGGMICGISNNTPWYLDGNEVKTMPATASISLQQAVREWLLHALQNCTRPVMCASAIFALCTFFWLVLVHGHHILWKLLLFECVILAGFVLVAYFASAAQYRVYVRRNMQSMEEKAALTAQLLNGDDVLRVTDSTGLGEPVYRSISRRLVENYPLYETESDTAAVLLVSGPDGKAGQEYCILASNRGLGDLMGRSTACTSALKAGNTASFYDEKGRMVAAFAPVRNAVGRTVGYLCLYTTIESVRAQFRSLWPPLAILSYFLVLLLVMFATTMLLTRRLKRATNAIEQIGEGHFNLTVPVTANDEIGTLIRCVNSLSQSIGDLIDEKSELTEEISKSQSEVLSALASIVEVKSGQTAAHVERVSQCVRVLAAQMGYKGKDLEYITIASMLHDVGKVFVPTEILEKPGKLTPEEFEIVKLHTVDGEKLLHNAPGPIMACARVIALEHHEKWDGTGYIGLKGEAIHMEARITAVADAFDALISRRPYKEPYPKERVFDSIISESGRHFDPKIVDAFRYSFLALCEIIEKNPD